MLFSFALLAGFSYVHSSSTSLEEGSGFFFCFLYFFQVYDHFVCRRSRGTLVVWEWMAGSRFSTNQIPSIGLSFSAVFEKKTMRVRVLFFRSLESPFETLAAHVELGF